MASRRSPASASADSRLSANTAAAAMVAESSSRACGRHAPTALMWVPSASQDRSSTGVAEDVAVTTMPAPATASAADPQARTGTPAVLSSAAACAARPGVRPAIRIPASGRPRAA